MWRYFMNFIESQSLLQKLHIIERERERDREWETDRQRETDTETDRQTEGESGRDREIEYQGTFSYTYHNQLSKYLLFNC